MCSASCWLLFIIIYYYIYYYLSIIYITIHGPLNVTNGGVTHKDDITVPIT